MVTAEGAGGSRHPARICHRNFFPFASGYAVSHITLVHAFADKPPLKPAHGRASMIKDEIVKLLPDLRAFARFMCREREAADELVQNTVLAALDKQEQFTLGTNLKGWLFTIMRNRFYSDLRSQRRRPSAIDDPSTVALPAVDNPEATLELKELSSALWELSPQSREALILVGAGGFSYEEAANLCECSVGTLKARVSRARKQLSERMK
ncbi:MAG TPA: sigma-70 family RNA polymerase sigma factor [Reyranella sp.]|nr:sigma-70 family RNA polymerase sigma factor [Reyranella sp.]